MIEPGFVEWWYGTCTSSTGGHVFVTTQRLAEFVPGPVVNTTGPTQCMVQRARTYWYVPVTRCQFCGRTA